MPDVSLLEMILPEGLLKYFDVSKFKKEEASYRIYLSEKNIPPIEFSSDKLVSKGYFDEITVQDFPIRGKASYLHIKRRRWLNETTGDIVYRDWNIVAKGTRMTHEFAAFLKAIARYQASQR
jgi:hypothetical protein